MSELFTQTNKQKKLFRTEEDIVANIQTQFGMPHTGKDLLLDAKMGPNKNQSSRLDSEPDALSDTGMSDDVGAGDTSGILHDSAGGNKKTIAGTNTPRASRASAYYDLLRSQHKNGHYKAPAYRVVDTIESPLQAGASALNYHDDFDTDAVQNAGLHMAVAQTVVEGNIMAAAADSAFVIGKQAGNILKDLKDETIDAKDALKAGGQVLRLQGGKSVVKIGGATLRSTEQYLSSFQVSTDDFTGSVPGKVKEAATNTGNILKKITNVVLHPLRNLIAMGKVILIGAVILLFLIIVSLLGQMSGTTSTSVFGANRIEDIQTLVQKINDYRNAAVTEGIYQAFQNDVDPNGNPYGYDSLTGQRSNNLQHGVTWNYANGIYNDTAEIISLAAVYYQQDWPRSELVSAFGDNVPFTKFCRALAAYGLDVTARESAPYSCMSYGGCVNGYRSEGEVVSIKDYRLETHTCSEGDDACGQYDAAAEWHWNEGHAENESYTVWKENGTHDVTVFFPVIFPDGATGSELSDLPEEYNAVADGKIKAADCTGNIVLDDSANLYKGELNDWFYTPDELTVTFTVVTGEGDDAVSDDYEVTFSNATAIPWCPGELNDGQYGHYDLDCTIYLTGYDRYTDPETQAPNGADGGTGNLEALAESCDAGTLTRTIIKQDQYGNEYAGNAVSARYTKTITLPNGANGFQGWYKDGEDAYGNVEWASLLYRMDWEELYGIVDGIKCRATGSGMTEEELRQLFASLNIDATTARGQVVAFALSCQGKFVYERKPFLQPLPDSNAETVVQYLKRRGIDGKILKYCINQGILYQTTRSGYKNCVFIGMDSEGKPRSASLRGCQGIFRGECAGSAKRYGFCIPPKNTETDLAEVYEAPIDLLSGATLHLMKGHDWRQNHYVSLGGLNYVALDNYLENHPEIHKLIYKPLIKSGYKIACPTLTDLYNDLKEQPHERAHEIALALELFATGSMNMFAHPTNVDMSNRLICFNIQSLGDQLKPVAMLSMLEYIRMATLSESSTNISHTSSSVVRSRGVVALLPTLLMAECASCLATGVWSNPRANAESV